MTLHTVLTEYGVPVERRAVVNAQLEYSDGSVATFPLVEIGAGRFEASITAKLSGLYRFRVVAAGISMRGLPFTREQLLTGAVFRGGDDPIAPPEGTPPDDCHCRLITCLLDDDGIQRYLKERGVDATSLKRCVDTCCR
jgi:hypothetical protein